MSRKPPKGWDRDTKKGSRVPETPCVPMKTPIQGRIWNLWTLKRDSPNVRLLIELPISTICWLSDYSRGGYLICRYLIEVKDMAPSEAIRTFEDARGQPF